MEPSHLLAIAGSAPSHFIGPLEQKAAQTGLAQNRSQSPVRWAAITFFIATG